MTLADALDNAKLAERRPIPTHVVRIAHNAQT